MKIEQLRCEPLCYEFSRVLRTGGGQAVPPRRGFRVELCAACGLRGRGEVLPLPAAGTEPLEESGRLLERAARAVLREFHDLGEFLEQLDAIVGSTGAARCGLDVAAHDLEGQLKNQPVARLLSPAARRTVRVNGVVGSDDLSGSLAAVRDYKALGYRTLKLKLGGLSAAEEERRIASIRGAIGPELRLRLDANGAWSVDQALERIERLAPHDIEFLEQPVAADDLEGLARVAERSAIPIAADESLATPEGRAALEGGALTPIAILKPMVLGGLQPAAQLARRCAAHGGECVVTTTFEGPVGTAAALQLAAASGAPSRAHGLASCELIDTAFPAELVPRAGQLVCTRRPGLGELRVR